MGLSVLARNSKAPMQCANCGAPFEEVFVASLRAPGMSFRPGVPYFPASSGLPRLPLREIYGLFLHPRFSGCPPTVRKARDNSILFFGKRQIPPLRRAPPPPPPSIVRPCTSPLPRRLAAASVGRPASGDGRDATFPAGCALLRHQRCTCAGNAARGMRDRSPGRAAADKSGSPPPSGSGAVHSPSAIGGARRRIIRQVHSRGGVHSPSVGGGARRGKGAATIRQMRGVFGG